MINIHFNQLKTFSNNTYYYYGRIIRMYVPAVKSNMFTESCAQAEHKDIWRYS
jgi:hypothetical protein